MGKVGSNDLSMKRVALDNSTIVEVQLITSMSCINTYDGSMAAKAMRHDVLTVACDVAQQFRQNLFMCHLTQDNTLNQGKTNYSRPRQVNTLHDTMRISQHDLCFASICHGLSSHMF